MAELTVIADFADLLGECPVWESDQQALLWTDIAGRRLHRFSTITGQAETLQQGIQINGFRRNAAGGFVITNSQGIWRWNGANDLRCIASAAAGSRCQVNDCVADAAGRLLTGSWFDEPSDGGKLLSVDCTGAVTVLDEGFGMANGLGFAPDERTLYFTDSRTRRIYAYDYDVVTGTARQRRVFVQVPSNEGLPDGLAVDSAGFVWSAQWYGSCVVRYDPDGKVERRLLTPAKQTTAVAFGGRERNQLFITTAGQSGPGPLMPPGYDPVNGYFGGRLYAVQLDIQGKPEHQANIIQEII